MLHRSAALDAHYANVSNNSNKQIPRGDMTWYRKHGDDQFAISNIALDISADSEDA